MNGPRWRPRLDRDHPRAADERRRPVEPLVRPAKRRAGGLGTGAHAFGVVRIDSGEGTRSSYLVDVYGTTVASLDAAPAQENQDAVQSPASYSFVRGEVVAVRLVEGDWLITKLYGTALSGLVEAGDLGCRPVISTAVFDVAYDYAAVRDIFLAEPTRFTAQILGKIDDTYWTLNTFSPLAAASTALCPVRLPDGSSVAAIDTVSALSGAGGEVDLVTRFSAAVPTRIGASLLWWWAGLPTTNQSMTWAAETGLESARTRSVVTYAGGSTVAAPQAPVVPSNPPIYPDTVSRSISGSLTISVSTDALCPLVVPVGGVSGSSGFVLRGIWSVATDAIFFRGWEYAPGNSHTTNALAGSVLAADGASFSSGTVSNVAGTGTLSPV